MGVRDFFLPFQVKDDINRQLFYSICRPTSVMSEKAQFEVALRSIYIHTFFLI
jgi:hypothetical protein